MSGQGVDPVSAEEETLERLRGVMREGARLDIVRLYFGEHEWGVQVWGRAKTRGGNDKWVKALLVLPNEGETVAHVLSLLAGLVVDRPEGPVEEGCVEHLHQHVGICYRRGLADGFRQGRA